MEDGFILMNLSKHKSWRAHRLQNNNKKREQAHPVCLLAAERYEKVESVSICTE